MAGLDEGCYRGSVLPWLDWVQWASRHMIGNSLSFAELKECSVGYVTFGDGVKGTVVRKGNIDRFGALVLSNLQKEQDKDVRRIRSDHGKEFENSAFNEFFQYEGIFHEFSTPLTPQQNGVVERKNHTLQQMAYYGKVVNQMLNTFMFSEVCAIFLTTENFTASGILNQMKQIIPYMNPFATSNEFVSFDYASLETDSRVDPTVSSALHESIKDDSTVSEVINSKNNDIDTALKDDQWITAMQKEVLQFECNKVWELIPKTAHANVIDTKRIFKNKIDEKGCVTKNKARLVTQGFSHIEMVGFL
ncbi:uncharacterized protein LOC127149764 [Cucumis melo]|uniref:Uncharacterized protein LOC127149764 n=1 Tax=Cucumis melo TaxID=3656 RepID=A0ABM3KUX7_CUCME|nr:uncharacterized protein LOC127149764 [Cucumis melo]